MQDRKAPAAGLDTFWEQADSDGSCEHPLERELCYRLDAMARYQQLIDDALAGGRDEIVEALLCQHDRQSRLIDQIRAALQNRSHR